MRAKRKPPGNINLTVHPYNLGVCNAKEYLALQFSTKCREQADFVKFGFGREADAGRARFEAGGNDRVRRWLDYSATKRSRRLTH